MPARGEDDGRGQAGHRAVGMVGVEHDPGQRECVAFWKHPLYHTAAATSPPPPHHRHRNRCPCGDCCVCWELSTPGEASFPTNVGLAVGLAVGRVVGRLHGGEGEGTILCHNQESVLGFGGGRGAGAGCG